MTRRGPGEGSIYPRGDGRWEGAVHLGYENGRRVRTFAIGHSRKEVADKLAVVLKARDESRPIPDQRQGLGLASMKRWPPSTWPSCWIPPNARWPRRPLPSKRPAIR